MLGSASEIAWTALGESLITLAESSDVGTAISNKNRNTLTDRILGIGKKIPLIVELYQQHRQTHFEPLVKSSGVRPAELEAASIWAHNTRNARNALHPGDDDKIAATYETVSMLLLATPMNLGMVYKVIDAATNFQNP
jgi:hypothetical protein